MFGSPSTHFIMTNNIVFDNSNIYLIYCCISSILLFNYSHTYQDFGLYLCECIFTYMLVCISVCVCVNFACCLVAFQNLADVKQSFNL